MFMDKHPGYFVMSASPSTQGCARFEHHFFMVASCHDGQIALLSQP